MTAETLLCLSVQGMLAADSAVLIPLKPVGGMLFVFHRVIVPLFALRAGESDSDSHDLTAPP